MLDVGIHDVFERKYTQKFREFAGNFGEFVVYERDRGARDIGLHLTKESSDGGERVTTALCWFQLKGLHKSTLSQEDFGKNDKIKISLKVKHLRFWFLQPMPTYLVVYVECVDKFLIQNIQDYVSTKWGADVLQLDQESVTVAIPKSSEFDEQAVRLIISANDVDAWTKALETKKESAQLTRRDYSLIWHLGTANERNAEHRVRFMDWITKGRGQLYIQERVADADWEDLREHLQYMLMIDGLEQIYPYIEFYSRNEDDDWDADYCDFDTITLSNGDTAYGENCGGEYYLFEIGVRLNSMGIELFNFVLLLEKTGLVEIEPGTRETITIAPWHARNV